MERVTENIYEWTGHRELTEKDRKYLAELKKDTKAVFGEPIDEKEVANSQYKPAENEEEIER